MPDIMHLVRLEASAERVYPALTTPEGVRAWWTADANLDAEPGDFGEVRFYGGEKVTRVRIEALDPPSEMKVASSVMAWPISK